MSECVDNNVGKLLHAYELGMLGEIESEQFEIHLLQCPACFAEIQHSEVAAMYLRHNKNARAIVGEIDIAAEDESHGGTIWRYLWPAAPVIFRPAVAAMIILILLIPSYRGIQEMFWPVDGIRPAQVIHLTDTRSNYENAFSIKSGLDGLISFPFPQGNTTDVSVCILDDGRREIYHCSKIYENEESGLAELLIPHSTMKSGAYSLLVIGATGVKQDTTIFRFQIR